MGYCADLFVNLLGERLSRRKYPDQKDISLDGYSLLYSSDQVSQGISDIAESILGFYSGNCIVNIVPVMTGGMQFAASVLTCLENQSPGKWKVSPVFCSTYTSDSVPARTQVEFPSGFDTKIELGAPTLILDDIYDSGRTMGELFILLKDKGLKSVKSAVLINRIVLDRSFQDPDFAVFDLDSDKWVVGYGLDSNQLYRGLSGIYTKL